TFRYAKVTALDKEWSYSDRDQRHRVNAWLLYQAPWGVNVDLRYAYRSAQPQSITATGAIANTPQDRINPDGSVTRRNLGRKDNQFSSLDFRVAKGLPVSGMTIEPAIDVFNVLNATKFPRPEVAYLVFNLVGS